MQLQEVFWQEKLPPKQLVVDWDKFIFLFDQFILQTISLKLNHIQKEYIKTLIDPENRHLVHKNAYLLFVKNFWNIPSNRTKLLKGQLNLTKLNKFKFISDLKDLENIFIRVQYLPDTQKNGPKKPVQKFYELRKNKLYELDPTMNIISEKTINQENFLSLGRQEKSDIAITNCAYINLEHLKLIKFVTKKKKEKTSQFIVGVNKQKNDQNDEQTKWYLRDVSKSNRLQYFPMKDTTYIVMRAGMIVKFGLTDQYELHVVDATPDDVKQNHLKELQMILNANRINYMGEIDSTIPEKTVIDIPIDQITPADVNKWFDKGLLYPEKEQTLPLRQKRTTVLGKEEKLALSLRLVDKVTRQVKDYQFSGEDVVVGRNKSCQLMIDKVTIRNFECQFFCVLGIWMLRNSSENCIKEDRLSQSQKADFLSKKLKINKLSVGLSTTNTIENLQSSNRLELKNSCDHNLGGKDFIVNISFPKIKNSLK